MAIPRSSVPSTAVRLHPFWDFPTASMWKIPWKIPPWKEILKSEGEIIHGFSTSFSMFGGFKHLFLYGMIPTKDIYIYDITTVIWPNINFMFHFIYGMILPIDELHQGLFWVSPWVSPFESVPESVPIRSHPPRGQVAAELTSRCDPLQFAAPWMSGDQRLPWEFPGVKYGGF